MKKFNLFLLVLGVFFMLSCSKEYDLKKSVFIEDSVYEGLPEYSEWGYNTFGAYINREVFVSNQRTFPAKIIVNSDTLNLQLIGEMYDGKEVILNFSFIGYPLENHSELVLLNNTTFDLTTSQCIVTLTRNRVTEKLDILENSRFFIQRAQKLYVDNEYIESIISGHFNLKAIVNNTPVAISNGRFDLGIGYDNFYSY